MSLSANLVEHLEAHWGDARDILVAAPVTGGWQAAIRQYAGFDPPASYVDFVSRYGAAMVGPYQVYGQGSAEALALPETVEELTSRFREAGWPGVDGAIVISTDHAGNPIMLCPDGSVARLDHDSRSTSEVWPDFDSFLQWCMAE